MSERPGADTPVGTDVHADYRKWTDGRSSITSEHWQEHARWLGVDEYGCWLGLPTGTPSVKPSFGLEYPYPHVKLITEAGWAANICRPPTDQRRIQVYADMITVPEWAAVNGGYRVTMIDLDLDVISWTDGSVMIDDEDEFAEHQVRFHYPAEATVLARDACQEVERLLRHELEPFGIVAEGWLSHVGDEVRDCSDDA